MFTVVQLLKCLSRQHAQNFSMLYMHKAVMHSENMETLNITQVKVLKVRLCFIILCTVVLYRGRY